MAKTSKTTPEALPFPPDAGLLLNWYGQNGRKLPWREHGGRAASPYHTWLSEIMLQQTQVATVIPYYERFTSRWPDIRLLAQADEQEVLGEWAGLGYYSRARNLLRCARARAVASAHGGSFPSDLKSLKALPGIGEYTANAIRAIAFDLPANVVDGNVERVIARVSGFDGALNEGPNKIRIRQLAGLAASTENAEKNSGDYAQALMDLGAVICTPRKPACPLCPWRNQCNAYATGRTESIPVIQRRAKLPQRQAALFVLRDHADRYFLRQRPSHGLLGGLWEFPSSPWDAAQPKQLEPALQSAPLPLEDFIRVEKPVIHIFTHFKLKMIVYVAKAVDKVPQGTEGTWFGRESLPPMPTLMKKVMSAAIKTLGDEA